MESWCSAKTVRQQKLYLWTSTENKVNLKKKSNNIMSLSVEC